MILNTVEYVAMNNPVRAAFQRRYEARKLLRMGGAMHGGRALEIGCGRGVGVEIILGQFGAEYVDAFDLDPRMVAVAAKRIERRGARVRLWVGNATRIDAEDGTYDAVFDFGIIHHIPEWRNALAEVYRVLKPGGRFYAEEVLSAFIHNAIWKRVLDHPVENRFDYEQFKTGLTVAGFALAAAERIGRSFAWYVADKPETGNRRVEAGRAIQS